MNVASSVFSYYKASGYMFLYIFNQLTVFLLVSLLCSALIFFLTSRYTLMLRITTGE